MAKKKFGGKKSNSNAKAFVGNGRPRKLEIKFDPEARKEYLTGFRKRKTERRTFGLAMQRLKDRKNKLDERKDRREAEREKVEEMEMHRNIQRGKDDEEEESNVVDEVEDQEKEAEIKNGVIVYNRENPSNADSQFFGGGVSDVVVHVQYGIPSHEESDEDELFLKKRNESKSVDKQQRWAGNVKHFMDEMKGKLPAKKSSAQKGAKRKGKHGAGEMKGMGGSSNLKAAKKMLRCAASKTAKSGKNKKKR